MSEFKREPRYYVFKISKLDHEKDHELFNLKQSLGEHNDVECVVVEHDWPCYEATWKMIEQVANGEFTDPFRTIAELTARAENAERENFRLATFMLKTADKLEQYEEWRATGWTLRRPAKAYEDELNQLAIQQKIEVLEKFHSDTDDVLLDDEKVAKLEVLDAITHRIKQLRTQLEGE